MRGPSQERLSQIRPVHLFVSATNRSLINSTSSRRATCPQNNPRWHSNRNESSSPSSHRRLSSAPARGVKLYEVTFVVRSVFGSSLQNTTQAVPSMYKGRENRILQMVLERGFVTSRWEQHGRRVHVDDSDGVEGEVGGRGTVSADPRLRQNNLAVSLIPVAMHAEDPLADSAQVRKALDWSRCQTSKALRALDAPPIPELS